MVISGRVGAIVFPIAGLVTGLILISRGDSDQGGWITAVSLAMSLVGALVIFGAL